MAIEYRKNLAVMGEQVTVAEAEELLEWIQQKRVPKVDFSACTHLHPANLQVLMAANCQVAAWPEDEDLRRWLMTALIQS